MQEVIRRVKGKGFQNVDVNQTVHETAQDVSTSADKIKGIFGRKTVYIEWENTDTGELVYIGVKPLRPAEMRLIGEEIFTESGLDIIQDDNLTADQTTEKVMEHLDLKSEADVMLKYREFKTAICMKVLEDEALRDEEWLLNEATDDFLQLVHSVGIGGVTETTTVDNFPEVDSESSE